MLNDNDLVLSAIEKAVSHNVNFFAYSLPGEEEMHFGAQMIEQQIPDGFLIFPFVESLDTPSCFISAQFSAKHFLSTPITQLPQNKRREIDETSTTKEDYITQAQKLIAAMKDGEYRKVVLSRVICDDRSVQSKQWSTIFNVLKENNPNSFVFIFNTEESGSWIGASPEKYLAYDGVNISTAAIAGTRLKGTQGEWGKKEIEEHAFVVDYIKNKFAESEMAFNMSPRYNCVAGGVEHLCNDFVGSVSKSSQVNAMRNALHPTPALGGIPAQKAVKYICDTEIHKRRYYGGYVGPIDAKGNFDFYVNLRSLEFDNNRYCVYAGGGLTADSIPENEWEETSHKARTLLSVIDQVIEKG